MEILSSFSVPDAISFEQAIEVTQSLLDEIEQNHLSETDLESIITALVQTENGARGFFVTYLSDDRAVFDHPTSGIIQGLKSSPEVVAQLLTKNLAMSTAMIETHTRNNKPDLASGSERVQRRTKQVIERLQLPELQTRLQILKANLETGDGEYESFLQRWQYDAVQRHAIAKQVQSVLA
jgi:hypothetical protein